MCVKFVGAFCHFWEVEMNETLPHYLLHSTCFRRQSSTITTPFLVSLIWHGRVGLDFILRARFGSVWFGTKFLSVHFFLFTKLTKVNFGCLSITFRRNIGIKTKHCVQSIAPKQIGSFPNKTVSI